MYLYNLNKEQWGKFFCFGLIFICVSISSCGQNKVPAKIAAPANTTRDSTLTELKKTISGNFSNQTALAFDSVRVAEFLSAYPAFRRYAASIRKFYRGRNYTYAWFDKDGLIEQSGSLTNRVLNLEQEGITKELPYRTELDSLLADEIQQASTQPNLQIELMLTATYFAFARTAWQGLNDSVSQSLNWFVPRKKIAYAQLLDSLLNTPANETMAAREPVYHQYEVLRSFLKKYQQMNKKQAWETIKASRSVYKPGDKSSVITQIKKRLQALGDFTGDTSSNRYDTALVAAVTKFQNRHGLAPDGNIGANTLAEMNVPLETRIKQLMVNMERTRWLPVNFAPDYLVVNIPEYKLHIYLNGNHNWSCRVVVGKAVYKTVIFSDEISYIVFSPYWYLPASIVRDEVVSGMRRSRGYLARHNMEITGRRNGLPVVRQKPGPRNSLGQVKFMFPNRYNIYLHDTPSKSLFKESARAFSHGCIRVSEPVNLAEYLLSDQPAWTTDSIKAAMQAGRELQVDLSKPVPVYITYFTAFTDEKGLLNFRKDIYNRDERLANMLLNEAGL